MSASPPRLPRQLLLWVLPDRRSRDGLVGDLDELYRDRAAYGRVAAGWWYSLQVLAAVLHFAPRRALTWGRRTARAEMWTAIGKDLGLGVRLLRRRPGFATVVAATLALGIGVNVAAFSVLRSVVLRPLPFPDADRLAVLRLSMDNAGYAEGPPSIPEYLTFRDELRSWQHLAAYRRVDATATGGEQHAERVSVAVVSPNLFQTLGVQPLHGRAFTADESQPGAGAVAVLSHAYWQSRYGADPSALGRDLIVAERARTIVGVMPAGFGFPDSDIEIWVPLGLTPQALAARGVHQYDVVGRLLPGVSLSDAEAELAAVTRRVAADPLFNFHDWHPAFLRPLRVQVVGDMSRALWLLLGAAGLVLAVACANVAGLMLVRSEDRGEELAIRTALGAGRGRLRRQLFLEAFPMTVIGALAGVAVALGCLEIVGSLAPLELPRAEEVSVDMVGLTLTVIITLGVATLFAVLPSLGPGEAGVHGTLGQGERHSSTARTRTRFRHLLVGSETAVAVVLLVSAGLLLQSYLRLSNVDPGYSRAQVITAALDVPDSRYPEAEDAVSLFQSLLERVRAVPGIQAAGGIRRAPLSTPIGPSSIEIEGRAVSADGAGPVAVIQVATPGYFEALGIRELEGRTFDAGDRGGAVPVAIVSESLARRHWPGQSALGGRLRVDDPDLPFAEVVGVVADVRQNRLDRLPDQGTLYLPHAQSPTLAMALTVRSTADPTGLVSVLREEVAAVDPSVAVHDVRTIAQAISDTTASARFAALLQLGFALLGLLLSAIGLYGVLAFTVTRRTREIGIRIALGAEPLDVRRSIVRQGMTLVATSLLVGSMGALIAGVLLERFLFGTTAVEPITYGVVLGTLLTVGLLACWMPARRASSIDPMRALGSD